LEYLSVFGNILSNEPETPGGVNKEQGPGRVPWAKVLAEGTVIVVSILLAFWIDALGDTAREREAERLLLAQIRTELLAARDTLERAIDAHEMFFGQAREVLDAALTGGPAGRASVVEQAMVILTIGRSTYLATGTLDAALATNQLVIVRDSELRRLLALWPGAYEEFKEEEDAIRDWNVGGATNASSVRLAPGILALSGRVPVEREPIVADARPSVVAYLGTTSGQNHIAQRLQREGTASRDGRQLLGLIDEILARLDAGRSP
jgi:hypothetical protein